MLAGSQGSIGITNIIISTITLHSSRPCIKVPLINDIYAQTADGCMHSTLVYVIHLTLVRTAAGSAINLLCDVQLCFVAGSAITLLF